MFKNNPFIKERGTGEGLECDACEEGKLYRIENGVPVLVAETNDGQFNDDLHLNDPLAVSKPDPSTYANSLAPDEVNFDFASKVRIKQLANTWLKECADLLEDRGEDYGTREGNINRGTDLFNALETDGHVLQPKHQDLMQFCEKMARWSNKPKWDTATDMLNYLSFYLASEYKEHVKHVNN